MFQLRVPEHGRDYSLYLLRLPKVPTTHKEVTLRKKVRAAFGGSATLLALLLTIDIILGGLAVELVWFDLSSSTNNRPIPFNVQENLEGLGLLLFVKKLYLLLKCIGLKEQ